MFSLVTFQTAALLLHVTTLANPGQMSPLRKKFDWIKIETCYEPLIIDGISFHACIVGRIYKMKTCQNTKRC